MADITRSDTSYQINIVSRTERSLTVGALRDFVDALDREHIPDSALLVAEHANETRHFIRLRVHHIVVVAESADG